MVQIQDKCIKKTYLVSNCVIYGYRKPRFVKSNETKPANCANCRKKLHHFIY